jgi:hypothetical protein
MPSIYEPGLPHSNVDQQNCQEDQADTVPITNEDSQIVIPLTSLLPPLVAVENKFEIAYSEFQNDVSFATRLLSKKSKSQSQLIPNQTFLCTLESSSTTNSVEAKEPLKIANDSSEIGFGYSNAARGRKIIGEEMGHPRMAPLTASIGNAQGKLTLLSTSTASSLETSQTSILNFHTDDKSINSSQASSGVPSPVSPELGSPSSKIGNNEIDSLGGSLSSPTSGPNSYFLTRLSPNGDVLEQYLVGNCIGRGSFGTVFRAIKLDDYRTVALKRFTTNDKKQIATIMREGT